MATIGRLLSSLGLQLVAATAIAGPITYDNLDFQSTGQSMWGPGDASGLNIDSFLGVQWNESASIGSIAGGINTFTVPTPHLHAPSGWECHGFLCTGGHFHNSGGIHIHDTNVTVDTRTGDEVDVSTSGKVGFQFGLTADSGSVDTTVE